MFKIPESVTKFFSTKKHITSEEAIDTTIRIAQEDEELKQRIEMLEDMLAAKNAKSITSNEIFVTNHAMHQYKSRIGFNGSDDELRKIIYKECLKHLATMDKLPDGKYEISNNAILRIKDNTVCTVTPRTGLGKKAIASNKELQSARDRYNAKIKAEQDDAKNKKRQYSIKADK